MNLSTGSGRGSLFAAGFYLFFSFYSLIFHSFFLFFCSLIPVSALGRGEACKSTAGLITGKNHTAALVDFFGRGVLLGSPYSCSAQERGKPVRLLPVRAVK